MFVTACLAGSIPRSVREEWARQKAQFLAQQAACKDADERERAEREFRRSRFGRLERCLDEAATGPVWMKDDRVARLVANSFHFHDAKKYCLEAYCVMPNHVH